MAEDGLTPVDCRQLIDALDIWKSQVNVACNLRWREERSAELKAKLRQLHETETPPEPDFDAEVADTLVRNGKHVARRTWSSGTYIGYTARVGSFQVTHFWVQLGTCYRTTWLPRDADRRAHDWYEVTEHLNG
jgi:hypothetical protein